MKDEDRAYTPSAGAVHWLLGTTISALGVVLLVNARDDNPLTALAAALIASGLYLVVSGAVARGIQLARPSR